MKKKFKKNKIAFILFLIVAVVLSTLHIYAERVDGNMGTALLPSLGYSEDGENKTIELGKSGDSGEPLDQNSPLGLSGEEKVVETLGFSRPVFRSMARSSNTIPSISGLIKSGDEKKIVVIAVDNPENYMAYEYGNYGAGLKKALHYIYTQHDVAPVGPKNFVLYLGNTGAVVNGSVFSTVFRNAKVSPSSTDMTLKTLEGRVGTLTITGSASDPVGDHVIPPSDATSFSGISEYYLGTSTIIRNINLNTNLSKTVLYGNGNDLLLDRGFSISSFSTSVNGIYGGGVLETGILPGNYTLTVNSTNKAGSVHIFGGGTAGTITGDISLIINRTSNVGTSSIGGGNLGKGLVAGNIHVTINGLTGTNITYNGAGTGNSVTGDVTTIVNDVSDAQISTYYGGVLADGIYIGGTITNIIQPQVKALNPAGGIKSFIGGSAKGRIGTQGSGKPGIVNDVDTRNFGVDCPVTEFVGGNRLTGTIYGDIETKLYAGDYNQGGHIMQFHGVFSSIATPRTIVGYTVGASADSIRGTYKNQTAQALYGNVRNEIKGGCFTMPSGATVGYHTGAGRTGYIEGNVYTELGTETLAYGGNNQNLDTSPMSSNNSRAGEINVYWAGGGGAESVSGNINWSGDLYIKGNTQLVNRNSLFASTYGGTYSGYIWGDTANELYGGVVHTLEGGGAYGKVVWGNSTANVYGGQVDFLVGGAGYTDSYLEGNATVNIHDGTINGHVAGNCQTNNISGDSAVTITGGDFSGLPGSPQTGRTTLPQKNLVGGTLVGYNASSTTGKYKGNSALTIDFSQVSGELAPLPSGTVISGGLSPRIIGSPALGTDRNNTITLNIKIPSGSDFLNGAVVHGNGGPSWAVLGGKITTTIDAPDSTIKELSGSSSVIFNERVEVDVDINIKSLKSVESLVGAAGSLHNSYVESPLSKSITINFSGDPDDRPMTTIGTGGLRNFTHLTLTNYDIMVNGGALSNGATANSNNRDQHYKYGKMDVTNSSFGVSRTTTGSLIAVGDMTLAGDVTLTSPGLVGAVHLSSLNMEEGATLHWVRNGGNLYNDFTGAWSGSTKAYPVLTFSPAVNAANASVLNITNFTGTNTTGEDYYFGDHDIDLNGANGAGYGLAVEGVRYDFKVEGTGGRISHDVENVSLDPSTALPGSALASVAADTLVTNGWLIVPAGMTSPPALSFMPDTDTNHWVKEVVVTRGNEIVLTSPEGRERQGQTVRLMNPSGHYTFTAKFDNTPRITAKNAVLTESEAVALTQREDLMKVLSVSGRPNLHPLVGDTEFSSIQQPLGVDPFRVHNVTFRVTNLTEEEIITVKLYVVPNDAVINDAKDKVLWSKHAIRMTLAEANAIATEEILAGYTGAFYIDVAAGEDGIPPLKDPEYTLGKLQNLTREDVTPAWVTHPYYVYDSLLTSTSLTVLPGAPEIVSVGDLNFGRYTIQGTTKNLPLTSDVTLQVKDERLPGETWELVLTSSQLTNAAGTQFLPADRLVYMESVTGTEQSLASGYSVWRGQSISGTSVQTKTWAQGSTSDTVMLKVKPEDLVDHYSGTLTWSLEFTP